MSKEKMIITWNILSEAVDSVESDIRKTEFRPEYIIGVSRGGLIPAVMLSHALNVPLIPISYSSKNGAGDNKNHTNTLPQIYSQPISGTGEGVKLPRLLIIDDLVDSGHTLEEISNFYKTQGHEVKTAVPFVKLCSVHKPDFFGLTVASNVDGSYPWVVFPYE